MPKISEHRAPINKREKIDLSPAKSDVEDGLRQQLEDKRKKKEKLLKDPDTTPDQIRRVDEKIAELEGIISRNFNQNKKR